MLEQALANQRNIIQNRQGQNVPRNPVQIDALQEEDMEGGVVTATSEPQQEDKQRRAEYWNQQ